MVSVEKYGGVEVVRDEEWEARWTRCRRELNGFSCWKRRFVISVVILSTYALVSLFFPFPLDDHLMHAF